MIFSPSPPMSITTIELLMFGASNIMKSVTFDTPNIIRFFPINHPALQRGGVIINAVLFCSVKTGKDILQLIGGLQNFSGAFFIQLTQTSKM